MITAFHKMEAPPHDMQAPPQDDHAAHDDDAEVELPDDAIPEGAVIMTPVSAFSLKYTLDGLSHSRTVFGEHKAVSAEHFVRMYGRSMTSFVQHLAGIGSSGNGFFKLGVVKAVQTARNEASLAKACGWDVGCGRAASPSKWIFKKMMMNGTIVDLEDQFLSINIGETTLRVLPRSHTDGEPIWLCAKDLFLFAKLTKEFGAAEPVEKLPAGIRKRQTKDNVVYQVKKYCDGKPNFTTCKSLEEAMQEYARE